MKYLPEKPEFLFLLFAVLFGVVLVFLVPPLGGGDEGFHYHRVASIAYGQMLNKPVQVPSSIAGFIDTGSTFFHAGLQAPFHYTHTEWQKMSAIPLTPATATMLTPDYTSIHHPFSYAPQALIFHICVLLDLPPLFILYAIRLAGLAAGIALTFLAIRKMPSHQYALAAIALLPTITFYRGYLNADAFTNGLAFLFIATVLYETTQKSILTTRNVLYLAALAFILAQCKSAYLLLNFLALAIPAARFQSNKMRCVSLSAIILPGIIASIAWMITIKQTYFTGVQYHTWGGDVNPDQQMAFILHHPLSYLIILLKTIFLTPLPLISFVGLFAEVGPGYFLPSPIIFLFMYFIIGTLTTDKGYVNYGRAARLLSAAIFVGVVGISLTMLYIQWTGLGAGEIKGFQGRYLYPLLPLLLIFAVPPEKPLMTFRPSSYVALLAFFGLTVSLWQVYFNYYT